MPTASAPSRPVATDKGDAFALAPPRENEDPFTVVTSDGRIWIEPYTGRPIAVRESLEQTRAAHLQGGRRNGPSQPLPLSELRIIRWQHELPALLRTEARMRIFARQNGAWIDPFTASLHRYVTTEKGRITKRTVAAMASVLAHMPAVALGDMLPYDVILSRSQAEQTAKIATSRVVAKKPAAPSEDTPVPQDQRSHLQGCAELQRRLLPSDMQAPGLDCRLLHRRTGQLTGCFYDSFSRDDQTSLIAFGQVDGQGLQQAFVATTLHGALRCLVAAGLEARDIMIRLNDLALDCVETGQCAWFSLLELPADRQRLRCLQAGDHRLTVVNPNAEIMARSYGRSGMALGLRDGTAFAASLDATELELAAGDMLALATEPSASEGNRNARRDLVTALLQYDGDGLPDLDATLPAGERAGEEQAMLIARLAAD